MLNPIFKRSLISFSVALACLSAQASEYFVVVPFPNTYIGTIPLNGTQTGLGISVNLSAYTLPTGLVGTPYAGFDFKTLLSITGDASFTGNGVTWEVIGGSLPAGLTLNGDGQLAGTPTKVGTDQVTLRATYLGQHGEQTYQIINVGIVVGLASATLPQALVGQAYSYDLKNKLSVTGDNAYNGTGVTWSVVSSTLPAGLALREDGTISGIPAANGIGSVTARATYQGVNGEQTYQVVTHTITVNIASSTAPTGVVSQAYNYDLSKLVTVYTDGLYSATAVPTWSIASGTLPPGLTLNANGTITGTPTEAGSGTVTLRASYNGALGEKTFEFVSLSIGVTLASATPPQGVVGQAYSYDLKTALTVSGDPNFNPANVSWSTVSATLPAGLALRTDGTIRGTPSAAGTGSVTARATYKNVNGEQTYQVVTLSLGVTLAAAPLPSAVVGQAYTFDLKNKLSVTGDSAYTGSGVTWSLVSGTLPAGLTFDTTTGAITGTPTASGTGTITAKATYKGVTGQQQYQVVSQAITVSIANTTIPSVAVGQAVNYDLKTALTVKADGTVVSNAGSTATWTISSGSLPDGVTLNSDGTITGTPTATANSSVTIQVTYKGVTGEQTIQFVTVNINVTLASGSMPQAVTGVPYTADLASYLTVTGDTTFNASNVTWALVSGTLPSGLTLGSNGKITGTTTAVGNSNILVRAAYKGVTGQQTYQLVSLNIGVTLATATLPSAIAGQAYSYDLKNKLTVTGDTAYDGSGVTWSVVSSNLPAGLSLRSDGTIAGTPTVGGTGSVIARATYKGVNGQQTYQVVTATLTVTLASATPPQAVVSQAYLFDLKTKLSVTGDSAYNGSGVTWSVVSDTLPAGLSLRTDGTIAGIPSASGTGSITVRASYLGVNGEQTYQVVSHDVTVSLASATIPQGVVGQVFSYDVKPLLLVETDGVTTANATPTWAVSAGTLPAGLILNANGTITGTPTGAANSSVTLRATYNGINGDQTYQFVTLSIAVTLAPATPTEGTVGVAYSYDLKTNLSVTGDAAYNGANVTWAVSSGTLPAGLTLNTTTGVISGTPTGVASSTVTLRATYKGVNGSQTYQFVSLNINISLVTTQLPTGVKNIGYAAYDFKKHLSVTGDANYNVNNVTFSASGLPAGMALSTAGVLSGAPTSKTAGTNFTVVATYKNKTGQQAYTLIVNGTPIENVTQVSVGYSHVCAVTTTNSLYCWGANIYAHSYPDSPSTTTASYTIDSLEAMPVMTSDVSSVAAGTTHTCILTTSGGVKCWGKNKNGQLGNNSTTDSLIPVDVIGLTSGVTSIAVGYNHTCALMTSGGVKCWGTNSLSQLGISGHIPSSVPVDVPGLSTGVTNISAGRDFNCVVTTAGSVKCWGDNGYGSLGRNSFGGLSPLVSDALGVSTGATSITTGDYHACALMTAGNVKCWGLNDYGQLGINSTVNKAMPEAVLGLGTAIAKLAAGRNYTCAITTAGGVKCWGANILDIYSQGTPMNLLPVNINELSAGIANISAQAFNACAVLTTGNLKCMGDNRFGTFGNNTSITSTSPALVLVK